jgi:nicotinate-nucleotide adenylyltransferase
LDSLRELRHENPQTPLCFFIGSDSLKTLPKWYRYQELFTLCHFIICQREGDAVDLKDSCNDLLQLLLKQSQTYDVADLHHKLAGHIYVANTQPLTLSSTHIRNQLINGQSIANFVPIKVFDYIQQHKLYQPTAEI